MSQPWGLSGPQFLGVYAAGMLKGLANQGFRTISIVDPGVKHDPGYAVYDDGLAKDVFCRTEGGDTYIGQVWPGNTAFPDFATSEARAWWGDLRLETRGGRAVIQSLAAPGTPAYAAGLEQDDELRQIDDVDSGAGQQIGDPVHDAGMVGAVDRHRPGLGSGIG